METTHKKVNPFSFLTPLLIVFMVAMILANLGGGMYGSLESLYLEDLGATVTQIGLFYTLAQIMPLLLQILGGWISDSLGRLRAIAIGSVFGTISQVILVLSQSWGVVLLSSMVGAGARSLVGPSFDAFIAENSEEHNRARVYGVTQTLFGLVSVVGPPIGGWLVHAYNFKTMLVIAAILYFLATIIRIGHGAPCPQTGRELPARILPSPGSGLKRTSAGCLACSSLAVWSPGSSSPTACATSPLPCPSTS